MSEKSSRRAFLLTTGAAALGIGCGVPLVKAFARDVASGETGAAKGPRWAMVVDVTKCVDECTACSEACHNVHNVPLVPDPEHVPAPGEPQRPDPEEEIKWIWKERFDHTFPDRVHDYSPEDLKGDKALEVPVLCNHCDNPPCVRVCPTQATWKRDDGIVMMDMHRCIGCRYCIVGCPYGARSFNFKDPRPLLEGQGGIDVDFPSRSKGVVEKCNFCSEKARHSTDGVWEPECVKACREEGGNALTFGDINDEKEGGVRDTLAKNESFRRRPALGTRPHVFYMASKE